jgi:hypothetical protein
MAPSSLNPVTANTPQRSAFAYTDYESCGLQSPIRRAGLRSAAVEAAAVKIQLAQQNTLYETVVISGGGQDRHCSACMGSYEIYKVYGTISAISVGFTMSKL